MNLRFIAVVGTAAVLACLACGSASVPMQQAAEAPADTGVDGSFFPTPDSLNAGGYPTPNPGISNFYPTPFAPFPFPNLAPTPVPTPAFAAGRTGKSCDSVYARLVQSNGMQLDLAMANDFLQAINAARAQNGKAAVQLSTELGYAARIHSLDMAMNGFFEHESPQGCTHADRISGFAGFNGNYMSENIAMGQQSVTEVMRSWMNSSGHRRNMMDTATRLIGIEAVNGNRGKLWTLTLAR